MLMNLMGAQDVNATHRPIVDLHPILTICGRTRIDLRDAVYHGRTENLSVLSLFGNVEMVVPDDLGLSVEGASIFGRREILGETEGGIVTGAQFDSPNYPTAEQRLNVTAISIFGRLSLRRASAPEHVEATATTYV